MSATARKTQSEVDEFTITRVFDAPRDLVWRAHTECQHLKHWWGPKGFKTTYCKIDLRPGGVFHYRLQGPGDIEMWGKFVYREVAPQERFSCIVSFSDEKQGITVHPMSPTWPREMFSTSTFAEQGKNKTAVTVRWSPHNATDAELEAFDTGRVSLKEGFTGTFDQLEEYLATL